jgi:hypothetical protein
MVPRGVCRRGSGEIMNKALLAIATVALGCVVSAVHADPPRANWRHAGPYPGGAYGPHYPAFRPVVPAWRASYWGPRAGVYIGAPAYWGGWPYSWGAGYAVPYVLPYAAAPLVVATAPQVIVQSAPPAGADSFWYYCTQPAGYFPYVQSCSQQWMKVVPQVPGSSTSPPQLAP